MKITIKVTPEEIAKMLQAIGSSEEQKLINDYEAVKRMNEAYSIRNHQTYH